jgi:hypothetical protein
MVICGSLVYTYLSFILNQLASRLNAAQKKGPHLDETMSIGCQNLRIVELRGKIMGFQSNKNGDL